MPTEELLLTKKMTRIWKRNESH